MSQKPIREIVGEIVIDAEMKAVGQAVLQELKRLQFRVAELESVIERLIEAGDVPVHTSQFDSFGGTTVWDALVAEWQARDAS